MSSAIMSAIMSVGRLGVFAKPTRLANAQRLISGMDAEEMLVGTERRMRREQRQ